MNIAQRLLAQVAIDPNDVLAPSNPVGQANIQSALQVLFGFAGAIAVIVIVLGGLKYVLSQGNPQETAKAKDTIMYALIGLVICIFAFTIVRFVIGEVS